MTRTCKHWDAGWCYKLDSKYSACPGYKNCEYKQWIEDLTEVLDEGIESNSIPWPIAEEEE